MRILLTGKNGQLGWELNFLLSTLGTVIAMGRSEMDLSKPVLIGPIIRKIKPDLIVNAAAFTAVDKAESEQELAMTVNGVAPGVIAQEAKKIGAGVIHYSTDYIFDGKASSPYKEEDHASPVNVYGKSKLLGETSVIESGASYLIFRTGWVYSLRNSNFLLTIQKLAQTRDQIKVVDDQIGGPTWAKAIAVGTTQVLKQCVDTTKSVRIPTSGIFHLSCEGETSWFEFAKNILELSELSEKVELLRIPTAQYHTPANRPQYSLLSNEKIKNIYQCKMPRWLDALKDCLKSSQKN